MRALAPADDLRFFDQLIGAWDMTGEATGTIRFEWMDGGFYLLQHVDLEQAGQHVVGVEQIGQVGLLCRLEPFLGWPLGCRAAWPARRRHRTAPQPS